MLEVRLDRIDREGTVLLDETVPAGDSLWAGLDQEWAGPVAVRFSVTVAGSGEIVARGSVRGSMDRTCRRCLDPVQREVHHEITLVYVEAPLSKDQETNEPADEGTYLLPPGSISLDLGPALREEVILATNPYVVCSTHCLGLCPECGAELNEASCSCETVERDPRWDALLRLKEK